MRRYYESTRIAQLLAKFATQNISESERRELTSLVENSGISIEDILKKTAYESSDASEIDAEKRFGASVERNISHTNRLPRKQVYALCCYFSRWTCNHSWSISNTFRT